MWVKRPEITSCFNPATYLCICLREICLPVISCVAVSPYNNHVLCFSARLFHAGYWWHPFCSQPPSHPCHPPIPITQLPPSYSHHTPVTLPSPSHTHLPPFYSRLPHTPITNPPHPHIPSPTPLTLTSHHQPPSPSHPITNPPHPAPYHHGC